MVYSLFDLNEYIRRVLSLNFQQALWIEAELAEAGRSRGHWYLDLVQKGPTEDIVAQAQAVLWANDYRRLRQTLGPGLDAVLQAGLSVKMLVKVDFHERYGLKFIIQDLDPAWTLGQLELRRRQTLATLRQLDLLERNRQQPLPMVLQRLAVISSETAAGYQDFQSHLAQNPFGYRFECRFLAAAVQGKSAEPELIAALEAVRALQADFDAVVILRGGGARLDLAAFDGLDLAKTVATLPLPVLTGIGHDSDESVLDLVSHTALKTPTAVADFLLQHNLSFEHKLIQLAAQVRLHGDHQLQLGFLDLDRAETSLQWSSRQRCQTAAQQLDFLETQLPLLSAQLLERRRREVEQAAALCAALDPQKALQRGYSITTYAGQLLRSTAQAPSGAVLETRLADGVVVSVAQF